MHPIPSCLLAALASLLLFSCAGPSKGTRALSAEAPCTDCLELRVHNQGPYPIEKLAIRNPGGKEWTFGPLAPGAYSPYVSVNQFCDCGYRLQVEYRGKDGKPERAEEECQYALPCQHYLEGKAQLLLEWPKEESEATPSPPFRLIHRIIAE